MRVSDTVFGALLLLFAAAVIVHVQGFPSIPGQKVGPALFPGLIAVGLGACGLALLVKGLRERQRLASLVPGMRSRQHVIAFAAVVLGTVGYILLVDSVGFLIVSPLFLALLLWAFGVRQTVLWPTAILCTLGIHYAFYKLLRVPLPWGILKAWAF